MQKASLPHTSFRILLLLVFAVVLVVDVLVFKMGANSPQCPEYFPCGTARFFANASDRRGVQIFVPKELTLEAELRISDATEFGSGIKRTAKNRTDETIADVSVGECSRIFFPVQCHNIALL